ncbi:hypothetical protein ACFFWD_20345, partial [Bradyrhizobium erythrophlei]
TARAFSSEVDTGSREENASKQQSGAPFRFYRSGKGSSGCDMMSMTSEIISRDLSAAQKAHRLSTERRSGIGPEKGNGAGR